MKCMTTESYVKSRRAIMISMVVMMVGLSAIMTLILSRGRDESFVKVFIPIMAGMMGFLVIEMMVVSFITLKKVRKIGYFLEDDGIAKVGKDGQPMELMPYETMKKVKIVSLKDGRVNIMRIKVGKRNLMLIGLSDMNQFAETLREKVQEAYVTNKVAKIDWYSLKTTIISMCIMVPLMILLVIFGPNLMEYVSQLILLAFGIYFLFFKPMTNYYGKKARIPEVVLSLLIIGTQSASMVFGLLNI